MKKSMMALCGAVFVSGSAYAGDVSGKGEYAPEIIEMCTMLAPDEQKHRRDEGEISKEEHKIMQLERELCYAYNAGNMDVVMDYTHDDAMLFPPGFGIVPGKKAVGELYATFSSANSGEEGFQLTWEPIDAFVSDSGEMAWAYGAVSFKAPGVDADRGKYMAIWRKVDGEWRYVLEMRNSNQM